MVAVALGGMRLDATLVTAMAFRRAFIPKLGLAFIRAVFVAGSHLAVTVFVTTFHCAISVLSDPPVTDQTHRNPPQIHFFRAALEAHRHHDVAELAVR